jgi:cytochrome d ubiquinol oxidase subunit II
MSAFFSSIGMPEIVAGLMVLFLNVYALLGGADFGGGVWDLLASGPRREEQRALIAESIAPIWEANHVWLIAVVVILFTGFPSAFATLSIVLHVPLTIMLIGIVMRGSAFMFRSYGSRSAHERHQWGLAFAIASVLTPILLGVIIGAISTGAVGRVSSNAATISFVDGFVRPWAAPFPLTVGAFTLSIFAFLAAVYATVAATSDVLRDDFRRRAFGAAVGMLVLAALCLILARMSAPRVAAGVAGSPWSIVLHLCTASAAVTAIVALVRRRYGLARIAAGAQVSVILWGWALSEYPYLIPDALTIRAAAAPRITLALLLVGLAAGGAILLPSLRYMLRIFAATTGDARAPSQR